MIDFKLPNCATRVFVFIVFIFIDSCVNFAKEERLKSHTLIEKVFLEIAWNIVSRSGTEINVLTVPTQKHGSYLSHVIS